MSFVSVDFYGARQMANEIEAMGRDCNRMAGETGLEEISEEMSMAITIEFDLAKRMEQAAADLRAAKRKLEDL